MFNWYRNYKLRKAEAARLKAEAIKKEIEEKQAAADIWLVDVTMEQTAKPCPFQEGRPCQTGCVHFKPGYVEAWFSDYMERVCVTKERPKCKLWK